MKLKNKILITIFIFSVINVSATIGFNNQSINYKTYFGKCPSRVAGKLTLNLVKTFEKTKSLKSLKDKIIEEKLDEKHFLSKYNISYNPLTKLLKFSYDCPNPLMKVQIYKENEIESYSAILVDNGQLFDPNYEILLRSDKKLKTDLPSLALPVGRINEDLQQTITKLVNSMSENLKGMLSEVIVNEDNELTVILSLRSRPSSAFFGQESWSEKVYKLEKIIAEMKERKRYPSIINLSDSKKVVVKFSDKF